MSKPEIVLYAPVRTPIGTYGGALKDTPASALGATVVRETLSRSGLTADKIDTVVLGNVIQADVKMNPGGRWGNRMGDAVMIDSMLRDGLNDAFSGQHSGWHTEDLVSQFGITREDQDRWAARSQQRFSEAQASGKFDAEILGVELASRKGPVRFDRDEVNRPDTTAETLAKLKPAFRKDGTISAGNAPGLNSGAAGRPWRRCSRARFVRLGADTNGQTCPGARGLDAQ